jgi:TRAP-type C4-dicarboxylate transport system permease small subunit
MNLLIKWVSKFNDTMLWLCKQLGIGFMGLMLVIVIIQVFFRYVLNDSLVWPEEVARFMMVWLTFLMAPIAYRLGSNVSLDMIYKKFKGRALIILKILMEIATLTTLYLLFDRSLGMVERGARIKATSIDLQMNYVYFCMPLGLALTAAVNIEMLMQSFVQLFKGDQEPGDLHPELSGE